MPNSPDRLIQPRRMLEQMKHCVEEALNVVHHHEDPRSAVDDLEQAVELGKEILKVHLLPAARGFNRGMPEDMRDPRFGE